jgi:hypothetical protein
MTKLMGCAILCGSFVIGALDVGVNAQQPAAADPAKQTQEQLAKKIRQEMRFLRQVVDLSPEQDQRLSAFDVAKLDDIRIQQRKVAPGVDFLGGQVRIPSAPTAIDPLKMRQIERAFEKEVAAVLTPKQHVVYVKEKKLRDEFGIETAVRGVLIILDRKLGLSREQRAAIYSSLIQWGGITSFDITPYESNHQYLPPIPDSVLDEHLSESQRTVLKSTARIDFGDHMQFQTPFNGDIELTR